MPRLPTYANLGVSHRFTNTDTPVLESSMALVTPEHLTDKTSYQFRFEFEGGWVVPARLRPPDPRWIGGRVGCIARVT